MPLNNPTHAIQTSAFEDNSLFVMARILGHAGTAITIASLTAITCKVYNGDTLVTSPTVTPATAVDDTLQTTDDDPRWTADATGYNFSFTVPGSAFPDPETLYEVEFNFDPTSGDDFNFVVKHQTVGLRSK